MLRTALASLALIPALALAGGGYKVKKMYSLTSIDEIEYSTYEELIAPLKKKVEKGKLDETDFKIQQGMTPKGGILAAKITTQRKFLGTADPVVSIKIMKDTAGAALETCDSDSQKPGLTMNYAANFHGSYVSNDDESRPLMIFECGLKRPLPDTFYLDLVTFDGKSKSRYLMAPSK
jgi:hypothetical protein